MTFTRFKCTPPKLSLHVDDLGKKIYFNLNLAFQVKHFQLAHPKLLLFFKYLLCFECLWCIYLYYS